MVLVGGRIARPSPKPVGAGPRQAQPQEDVLGQGEESRTSGAPPARRPSPRRSGPAPRARCARAPSARPGRSTPSAACARSSCRRDNRAARSRGPWGSSSSASPGDRPTSRAAAVTILEVQPSLVACPSAAVSNLASVSAAQSGSLAILGHRRSLHAARGIDKSGALCYLRRLIPEGSFWNDVRQEHRWFRFSSATTMSIKPSRR